jgi:hypothetical protein
MLAGIAEEGEAWMTTKCPTWTQQRVFYSIFTYYFLTGIHILLPHRSPTPQKNEKKCLDDLVVFFRREIHIYD